MYTSLIEEQLRILKQSNFNPRKIVLLDESDENYVLSNNVIAGSSDQDKVILTNYTPNRLELKSDSPSSTILLLSELYYPGWKAYVDGKETEIRKVDYMFRSVVVPTGTHTVTMKFEPSTFTLGKKISLASNILVWGGLLVSTYQVVRRKRKLKNLSVK